MSFRFRSVIAAVQSLIYYGQNYRRSYNEYNVFEQKISCKEVFCQISTILLDIAFKVNLCQLFVTIKNQNFSFRQIMILIVIMNYHTFNRYTLLTISQTHHFSFRTCGSSSSTILHQKYFKYPALDTILIGFTIAQTVILTI